MAIVMGPVLGFHGCDAATWHVSVLVVTAGDAPPAAAATAKSDAVVDVDAPVRLHGQGGRTVWRFDLVAARGPDDDVVRYTIDGAEASFTVPAKGRMPRMAFVSCNGFSDPKLMKRVDHANERWVHLKRTHDAEPYHVLVMGGDQVYADEIWTKRVPAVRAWSELPRAERVKRTFTDEMRKQVERFYFEIYVERWAQREPAAAMASIPTLMMWDDHDIFDG